MSRWTTLDRIVSVDPEKGARAFRNVTNTVDIFDTHFPRFQVLPGVLMLGSLADLAAVLLRQRTGHDWRLSRAEQVRFRHFVQPGDQMALSVDIKEFTPTRATFAATVKVEDKAVSTARKIVMVPRGPAVKA